MNRYQSQITLPKVIERSETSLIPSTAVTQRQTLLFLKTRRTPQPRNSLKAHRFVINKEIVRDV